MLYLLISEVQFKSDSLQFQFYLTTPRIKGTMSTLEGSLNCVLCSSTTAVAVPIDLTEQNYNGELRPALVKIFKHLGIPEKKVEDMLNTCQRLCSDCRSNVETIARMENDSCSVIRDGLRSEGNTCFSLDQTNPEDLLLEGQHLSL
jgi:hypothetical protein